MSNRDEDLVKQDAERLAKMAREVTAELGNVMDVAGPKDDTSHYGDGERTLISFHIGSRGELDWFAAQQYAKTWKTFRARHPKSPVVIFFLGYDTDPREIWNIPECTQYLRWFARAADINKPSDLPPDVDNQLFGIMVLCGVFGKGGWRMKTRKQFATREQRAAWQSECQREAAKRMLRRLMRELSRQVREPAPPGQHQLAHQYRVARAAHVKTLQRERDERVKAIVDERQLELM